MQLDIFEHSRDVMLRNDLLQALEQRVAAAAGSAWLKLEAEYPRDDTLPPSAQLVAELQRSESAAFPDHAAAREALRTMQGDIEPAALHLFGKERGAAWLAPAWRQLAQRASRLPFRAEHADEHAAPMFLKAGDLDAAAEAVAQIESWRRIPSPLAWMTEARLRLEGLDAGWGLLAELAWLSPDRLGALIQRLADPVLNRLARQFDAEFEADGHVADLAWFPAWVLTDKPALAALLGQAQPALQTPPERAMRLLLDLLHLERQGRQRDLVEQRRKLRDLQPSLFAAYIKSR